MGLAALIDETLRIIHAKAGYGLRRKGYLLTLQQIRALPVALHKP